MIRARLAAVNLLLMAARFLTKGAEPPPEPEEAEEEEDLPMPAGHPVVVRSEKAEEMILEGLCRLPSSARKPEPEAPLAGSLQDRMNRRDL